MLTRRFTDDKGRLYYFDKRIPSKEVITGTPRNFFAETHLYTFEHKDGTKDTELEFFFADIDGIGNELIEKIVTTVRKGQKPNLTMEERENWNLFFYYQWKRSPEVYREVHSLVNFDEAYQKELSKLESRRSLTEEERRNLQDPATQERIKKGATVEALANPGPLVQTILGQKGLGIVVIKKPNKSFVIGSKPVLKLNLPGRQNLKDPTVEVWLPVAHDVMVSPAPIPPEEERVFELSDDSRIRYTNEAILKQSNAIAGRSKELITSLAKYV